MIRARLPHPVFVAGWLLLAGSSPARALNVVGSTEDLAAMAREVGGDKIKVDFIGRGYQDPHFVEAKPSFILKLAKADLLVVVGRELEIGWLPPLIQQCRNAKIQVGADGYLDASLTAKILDIPTGQITRAMGDVHPLGNPHYWLDPENGRARSPRRSRTSSRPLSPADAAYFQAALRGLRREAVRGREALGGAMAPYKGAKIVTYHRSGPISPIVSASTSSATSSRGPGIPPTPQHTSI